MIPDDPKPAAAPEPDNGPVSINEPPGSKVISPAEPKPDEPAQEPLPSDAELSAMTRVELDELADERGVDSTQYATKADLIAALKAG